MGKVITVSVHCIDGVTCVTDSHFFHKDFGSQLVINGLNLETGTQVHFSLTEKIGKPISMIGVSENGLFSVDVPDNVLNSNSKRDDYEIYAFVYCTDENSGWTVHEIVIPVKMRPDMEFEQPTSEELTAFDKVSQYVAKTVGEIVNDREQINKNKEDIEYLKEHGVGSGDSEDYKLPQATETNLGGVKASPKTDNDTVEAKIGADGKLYVPTYPEQNETTVDSALDKTSTNPVQNKAVAEAVEKLSNNKLEKTALPDAINTALAQAKESGEFDGADGEDGQDGITPHIGNNGNWFIGDEDTGVSASGGSGGSGAVQTLSLVNLGSGIVELVLSAPAPTSGVSQNGNVLTIISGVTVSQNGNTLAIA